MKLTDIVPAEGKNDDVIFGPRLITLGVFKSDDNLPSGFGLRVRRASGGRILRGWLIAYRAKGGQRRMNIGDAHSVAPAQALTKARKVHAEIELGGDPQGDRHERREKDAATLRKLVSDYLAAKEHVVRPNTLRLLRRYLLRRAKPLHGTAVDRITRKDISKIVLDVSQTSGSASAGGFRGALSSLFVWAMQMGLVESNPVIGSFTPPRSVAGDRVLNGEELGAIWNAVDDDDYGRIVRLLICTACRREEIGRMRWTEFNDDMTAWTLPAARSKNRKAHMLPVTDLMAEVISAVPRVVGVDYLFGERGKGFSRWSAGRQMLDEKITLSKPWRLHDIRRSVATGMGDIGIMPHIIETILNHISGHKSGVAGIYNRARYEPQVRDALEQWSNHVRTLVERSERKIDESLKRAVRRKTREISHGVRNMIG
jgi:integrase